MPLVEHLRELRDRIGKALLFVALGTVVAWFFYDQILHFLRAPYCDLPANLRFTPNTSDDPCPLANLNPLSGFLRRIKVSALVGVVGSAPFWLYQVWAFVAPGLKRNEKRYTVWFVAASTVLFACGSVLAYLTLSKGLHLLVSSAGEGTIALFTIDDYLSFVNTMLVVFGASFEVPLLVVMLNLLGVLSYQRLRSWQRVGVFLIFVFAAIATPSQDPFTMCALAVPMCALFEGAVLFAFVHDRRKARREAADPLHDLPDDATSPLDTTPSPVDD
jgi:sec-independent protein translocase protein TatC